MYSVTMRGFRVSNIAVKKAISMKYYECAFVVLVAQGAKPIHRIIFSSVAYLALPYFFTVSKKKGMIFGKVLLYNKCVLIFSTTSTWNISYSKKNSARYRHKCT